MRWRVHALDHAHCVRDNAYAFASGAADAEDFAWTCWISCMFCIKTIDPVPHCEPVPRGLNP